jgi:hypothetical protein
LRRKTQGMLYERTAISRRPEELAIGLILCGEKNREQIELLQLDRGEIRVAEYLVELPPKGLREASCTRPYGWRGARWKREKNRRVNSSRACW